MTHANRFEGETTIKLQGGPANSLFYLTITLGFIAAMGWSVVSAMGRPHGAGELLACLVAIPPAIWFAASLVWRLTDPSPLFQADHQGLRLHPSLLFRPLPWTMIKSLSLQKSPIRGVAAKDVRILLKEPARGLMAPFGTREFRLSLQALRLSPRDGADLLRQLRRLRADQSSAEEEIQVS
ncbi:hypothetical protein [Caulobacter soli]|uniref:hypothetical protein n=1 Tax=Caulobacter soli TaxID=2708539 RepID=UPI0013ED19AD|nr:hypothetical protein [Caulobacter soli]